MNHKSSRATRHTTATGRVYIKKIKTLSMLLALPVALLSLFEKVPLVVRLPLAGICLLGCCFYIIRAKERSPVVGPDGKPVGANVFPKFFRVFAGGLIFLEAAFVGIYLLYVAVAIYFTPQIHNFHPDRVNANDLIEFVGTHFPKDPAALRVLFGNVAAEKVELRGQTVRATVPNGAAQPVRVVVSTALPSPFDKFETRVPIAVSGQPVVFIPGPTVTKKREIQIQFSLSNTSYERQVTITSLNMMIVKASYTLRSYRSHRSMLGNFKVILPSGEGSALGVVNTPLLREGDVYKLPPRQADSFQLSIVTPEEEHGVRFDFTFFANYFTDQGMRGTVFCDQLFHAVCSDLKGCVVRTESKNTLAAGVP